MKLRSMCVAASLMLAALMTSLTPAPAAAQGTIKVGILHSQIGRAHV